MKKTKELKPYKNKKLNNANFGDFTHNDYKVYLHIVSMIVKIDSEGNNIPSNKLKREYVLHAKDYNSIFNCNMKHAYDFLRKACDKLMNTNITINRIEDNTIWKINGQRAIYRGGQTDRCAVISVIGDQLCDICLAFQ